MDIQEQIRGIRNLVVREASEANRTVVFRGVTETVASDGGILNVDGANWSRMDTNYPVLWNHGDKVIGKIVHREIDKKDRAVDFHVKFAEASESGFAEEIFQLVKGDYIRASSIGFGVQKFKEPISEKERESLGLGPWGWIADEWTGHELSIVPVGADPKALKRGMSDIGLDYDGERELMRRHEAEQKKRTIESVEIYRRGGDSLGVAQAGIDRPALSPIDATTGSIEFTRFDSGTRDLVEALQANTEQHQRTQVAQETLTDEIAGLTEFLSRGEKVAEIEVGDKKPDTSDADDDVSLILSEINTLTERVAKIGDRNEQRNTGSD